LSHQLVQTSNFIRAVGKLSRKHSNFLIELNETLQLLTENAFDSRLKTHKLKGALNDYWACSINYDLRIIFKFVQAIDHITGKTVQSIMLATIGTHDEVY
jgi:addiction module RelE/StbE family toxin